MELIFLIDIKSIDLESFKVINNDYRNDKHNFYHWI